MVTVARWRVISGKLSSGTIQFRKIFAMGTYTNWKSLLSKIKLWKVYFRGNYS